MSSSTNSPKNNSGSQSSWIGRFILKATIFVAGLGLCGALLGSLALALAWPNLPDLSAMIDYRPRVPLRIYTSDRSEEHTSELQSLMRTSYAVFCLQKHNK